MALLLAVFQKMRLIREKNETALLLTRSSSRLTRVQKNIERVNKLFASRKTRLENQAKQMANSAKANFRNFYGLNIQQGYDPTHYAGNMFIANKLFEGLNNQNGVNLGIKDGKLDPTGNTKFNPDEGRNLLDLYNSGLISTGTLKDGKYQFDVGAENPLEIDQDKVVVFKQMIQQAGNMYTMATGALQQAVEGSEASISIWLEAEQERLEEEQDEALAPLSEQETRWELEKEQAELKLKRIEADLESYTQLADNEAKNSAPKFGL